MALERLAVAKHAGRLDDDVGTDLPPRDLRRIALGGHADTLVVDLHPIVVDRHLAIEAAHHRVVLEQVGELLIVEQVVDGDHLKLRAIAQDAEDTATDSPESVDSHSQCHRLTSPASISAKRRIRSTTRWT